MRSVVALFGIVLVSQMAIAEGKGKGEEHGKKDDHAEHGKEKGDEKGKSKSSDEKPAAGAEMAAPKPGPEHEALKAFAKSTQWTGKTPKGAMGPDSPEMSTKGTNKCRPIASNFWFTCDIAETIGQGKSAMKWSGQWTAGWDPVAKEYRGVMVDSWGGIGLMKGTIEGTKAVWEQTNESMMMGQKMVTKVTWDIADKKAWKFATYHKVVGKDADWVLDEEATHKPAGK